jgi:excisionase family DNA binding protein
MSTQTATRDGTVLLTPADAARVANVSRDTIYREIERGALPVRHVGRQLRIDPLDFGDLDGDAIEADAEPEPAVPTMAALREQAKALGIHVPPPREGSAEWFRDDMLRLLDAGTGPSAAGPRRKSTAPGQIATFEAPAALAQRFSISPRRGNPLGPPGSAR